jgi:hypothetical protein
MFDPPQLQAPVPSLIPGYHPFEAQSQDKVKRPPSAYTLFYMEHIPLLRADPSGRSGNDLSRELGQRWKHLPDIERQPYQERAAEIAREFREKNPDYHYDKARDRKISRGCRQGVNVGEDLSLMDVYGVDGSDSTSLVTQLMAQYALHSKTLLDQIGGSITSESLTAILNQSNRVERK